MKKINETTKNALLNAIKSRKLKSTFTFDTDVRQVLDIPDVEIQKDKESNDITEIWTFFKYDKGYKMYTKDRKYLISNYGRTYNLEKGKMLPQHDSSEKCHTSNGERYKYTNVALAPGVATTMAIHRLVALAFVERRDIGKDIVDHIDECPYHNYAWNLQWVDKSTNSNKHNMYVNRERTGRAVDTTWKYEELVEICKLMAEGHKATYIYNYMVEFTNHNPKIQYERIRTLYKHIMKRGDFHDIAVKCGVKFDSNKNVYLKENGSVKYNSEN